jgi:hypothetical protein
MAESHKDALIVTCTRFTAYTSEIDPSLLGFCDFSVSLRDGVSVLISGCTLRERRNGNATHCYVQLPAYKVGREYTPYCDIRPATAGGEMRRRMVQAALQRKAEQETRKAR